MKNQPFVSRVAPAPPSPLSTPAPASAAASAPPAVAGPAATPPTPENEFNFLCNGTWSQTNGMIDLTDCDLLEAVNLNENTCVVPAEPTPVGPRPASVDGDPQVAAVVGPPVQLVHGVLTSTAQPQAAFFLTAFSLQPSGLRSLRLKAIWPWAFKKLCCLAKIGRQQTSQ